MMLSTQLKLLKEKRKLTNQQLSDLSGVPVGTINRILSGQTDNPSFQTVCDMVMAMDGSLDELVGIQQEIPQAEKKAWFGEQQPQNSLVRRFAGYFAGQYLQPDDR